MAAGRSEEHHARMRASDAMRERVAERLGHRHAEGYLSIDTLAERLGAVHAARTVAELDAALADLPDAQPPWAPLGRRLRDAASSVRRGLTTPPTDEDEDGLPRLDLPLSALARRPLVIGRAPACDIQVAERSVSRRHAELRPTGAGWSVRDLGSTNGTLLNGRLVAEARVVPGDLLALGDLRATLR